MGKRLREELGEGLGEEEVEDRVEEILERLDVEGEGKVNIVDLVTYAIKQ